MAEELKHKSEAGLDEWAKGKFTMGGRYSGELYGNTDWALARLVWSAALESTQLPSQGGEAVAWMDEEGCLHTTLDSAEFCGRPVTPLYTHPADQVAEPTMAMVQAACAAFRLDVSLMEAMRAAICAALLAKSEGAKP